MGINTPLYEMPIKLNKGDFKCCSKQQFVEIPLRENCLCCSQFVCFSVSGQVMDGVYRDVLLRATDFFSSDPAIGRPEHKIFKPRSYWLIT